MLIFSSSLVFAADTFVLLGSENRVSTNEMLPRAKAIVDVPVADRLSITATFVAMPNYGEAYVGPTWHPSPDLSLGLAGGLEVDDVPWRAAAFASYRPDKLKFVAVVEYGGSGFWYKGVASYAIGRVDLGAMAQRFDGLGPRIAANAWGFEVWGAPLYDPESRAFCGLVGINWTP